MIKIFPTGPQHVDPLLDSALSRLLDSHPMPDLLFHYTTAQACFSIIGGLDGKPPRIWASSAFSTNDRSEVSYGVDLVIEFARNFAPSHALAQALTPHYKTGEPWQLFRPTTCVACFCSGGDLLSQWRAYGKSGAGYAIGFDPQSLVQAGAPLGFRLLPVVYRRTEQEDLLRAFFTQAAEVSSSKEKLIQYRAKLRAEISSRISAASRSVPNAKEQLTAEDDFDEAVELRNFWGRVIHSSTWLAMAIKSPHFAEENEWRVMSHEPIGGPLRFRALDRGIISYFEIPLPREAIREICLGPASDQEVNEKMLELFIDREYNLNQNSPKVKRSPIPLRAL